MSEAIQLMVGGLVCCALRYRTTDQRISRVQQSLRTGRWTITDTLLNVGETLAQCRRDNLNNGDHTPKYPNFCRAEECCCIIYNVSCMNGRRLTKNAHLNLSYLRR